MQFKETQFYTRALIEENSDALIVTDPSGLIMDVNRQMERISGCGRNSLIGTQFKDYFREPAQAENGSRKVLDEQRISDYELILVSKEGNEIIVSLNGSIFHDQNKKIQGVVYTIRDVSAQSKWKQELVESQKYNRGLIEASVDGLVTVNPSMIITDVNSTMCRMAGYTSKELIGSVFTKYFTDPKQASEGVLLTLSRGIIKNYDLILCEKNGNQTPVSFNASVFLDNDGKTAGIFASARDVSEAKRAEAILKKTLENLASSNAELQLILHITSHDLQEPLRMISSFLQLIELRYKDKLNTEANEFIEYAVKGAKKAQSQLNDLITYLEVTTYTEETRTVDCNVIIRSVLEKMKNSIESRGAKITWDTLPKLNVEIKHFSYLFQNLIENAIKFNERKPVIHIGVMDKDEYWLFYIKDNGIGIDSRYFEKLFIIFQRLNPKDTYPGNGIGLAICKKVIEHAGGKIWVKSKLGEGSTFYFTIAKNSQLPQAKGK